VSTPRKLSDPRRKSIGGFVATALVRAIAYLISAVVGWIVYFSCIAARIPGPGSNSDRHLAALIFSLVGGFAVALVLTTLAWIFVVWIHLKSRRTGPAYLVGFGALIMILNGCIASSLSWKPLFIEDQTFLEGVLIALKRQGAILAVAGASLGFVYWLLAERFIARKNAVTCLVDGDAGLPLAAMGGSDPQAEGAPRRRAEM
jgi:hypothetical protein